MTTPSGGPAGHRPFHVHSALQRLGWRAAAPQWPSPDGSPADDRDPPPPVGTAVRGESRAVARLVERHATHASVHTGESVVLARVAPGGPPLATLAVGDWVGVTSRDAAHWIEALLPRTTLLSRVEPSGARQTLVANVDVALLVMGLDGDFSPRRLERYLALVQSAGILPVAVLTKADGCDDPDAKLAELAERLPPTVDRLALDARSLQAVAPLRPYLGIGTTAVLLGSSGAGKSTLANTLQGMQERATGPVRAGDSRGRHTTTTRTLLELPDGGCLIDTPGLRGLRLDLEPDAVDAQFADIAELARACRFRDCTHADEPGCAVRGAVHPDRLANWRKLRAEAARDHRTPEARAAHKAEMKARQRALRALQKVRGR